MIEAAPGVSGRWWLGAKGRENDYSMCMHMLSFTYECPFESSISQGLGPFLQIELLKADRGSPPPLLLNII